MLTANALPHAPTHPQPVYAIDVLPKSNVNLVANGVMINHVKQ